MSRPEELLVAKLLLITAVTDLVGARIWPLYRESLTLPAVTYEVTGDAPLNHSTGTTKTSMIRLSVICWATTYSGAKTLAAAVRGDESETAPTGISGWSDANSSIWHLDSASEDVDDVPSGQAGPTEYLVTLDFVLGYTKT